MALASNFELELIALLAVMLVGSLVSRRVRLPYTLILVLLGILIAASSISDLTGINTLYSGILGSSFVALVLPPLLFESMMNIKSSELKSEIRPGIIMATVGVVVATIVGGLILWKFTPLGEYPAFLFSSLMSPTDTASVLEIFRRLHVPRKLAALMDAEAAFNDATGTIVFSLILTAGSVSNLSLAPAVVNFSFVLGGGILIGLVVGFGAELISSIVTDSLTETILSISMVYGSYAIATAFGFSGLVSVAVTGLYYGNLTLRTVVRPLSREQVKTFWGMIAFMANSVAFLFIGLKTNLISLSTSIPLILIAYSAVMVARIASVYPIMSFLGRAAEKTRRWKSVSVMGGMRGALSVALVATVPAAALYDQQTLLTMVLGVVFLSIVLQGPLLSSYIRRNFPEEQPTEEIGASTRLSHVLHAIEELHKLRMEGRLLESEFATRLEEERDRLAEVLSEINSSVRTGEVMKSRAKDLYASLSSISRVRSVGFNWRRKPSKPKDEFSGKSSEDTKDD